MTCPGCSADLIAAAKFCHACGHRIEADPPAAIGDDADRRVVTVLFAEVAGIIGSGRRLDPEAIQAIINQVFSALVEQIYRHGGVVDKYIGDAVMALFGAPVAHGNDVERAVRAAWEMNRAMGQVSREIEARSGLTVEVRIGLNTGLVVAGTVGGAERTDYTVLGDTVNLAQRMEANAAPGTVLVAPATYETTKHLFEYSPGDPIKVKGKSAPVRVFQLTGVKDLTPDLETDAQDWLIGRDGELERLRQCWQRAQSGRAQVVLVTGQIGSGKSAIVARFLRDIRCAETNLRTARPRSYDQQTPYALAGSLLRGLLGIRDTAGISEIHEALSSHLSRYFTDWEYRCGLLLHFLGVQGGTPDDMPLSPKQVRTGAFLALNDFVLAIAGTGPLLLDVEDLHWADPASLEWLTSLIERVAIADDRRIPLLILCQSRPEVDFPAMALAESIDSTTIVIRPLSRTDSASLLAYHLGSTPDSLPAPVRDALVAAIDLAEGNPFFLSELARAMLQSGYLVRSGATWSVDPTARQWRQPESVQGAVVARLDLLPAALRKWVQIASVLGRHFDPAILASVAREDAAGAVADLSTCNIFYSRPSGEVGFRQALTQEVAYGNLLLAQRRVLHARAGQALEAAAGEDKSGVAGVLAHHFAKAEQAEPAARYMCLAGDRARAAFSNVEAQECYRQALDWLGKAESGAGSPAREDVLLALATVETAMGNLEVASALLDARAATAKPTPRSFLARGDVHARRGNLAAALESYQAAAELTPGDNREHARALAGMGNIRRRMGQLREAIDLSQEARERLEQLDQPAEAAYAHGLMGICFARLGEPEQAMAAHTHALLLRERAGDIEGVANSLVNLGIGAANLGDWHAARLHYTRALEIFRKISDKPSVAMALNNLGDLLLKQGDTAQAERHFAEALRLARKLGDAVETVTALGNLAEALLARGAAQEALEHVGECLLLTRRTGFSEFADEIAHLRGRALMACGDHKAASAELEVARRVAQAAGNPIVEGAVDRSLALLAGSGPEALMLARRSEQVFRQAGSRFELARTLAVLSRVASGPEAEEYFEEAEKLFQALGAARDLENLRAGRQDRRNSACQVETGA